MNAWSNFFTAIAGAAAALTGLIFVGVSISLTQILSISKLPDRALESLILLLNTLIISALCLVPDQSAYMTGLEISGIGALTWVITLILDVRIYRKTGSAYKRYYLLNILFTQLAVLPYPVAGIMILIYGFPGIYWLIPGIILSLVKALTDAWVLLVEIHR